MNALILAFCLQIVGILLPALNNELSTMLISSALFGATFIGIVSLVLTMAGRFYPTKPAKLMGRLTLSYGVAQILAPAITGQLAEQTGSYDGALFIAAGIMAVGTGLVVVLKRYAGDDLVPTPR
jgi:MFS family permease